MIQVKKWLYTTLWLLNNVVIIAGVVVLGILSWRFIISGAIWTNAIFALIYMVGKPKKTEEDGLKTETET
jgi:hypothetical protein